jgi:hypothetical protein
VAATLEGIVRCDEATHVELGAGIVQSRFDVDDVILRRLEEALGDRVRERVGDVAGGVLLGEVVHESTLSGSGLIFTAVTNHPEASCPGRQPDNAWEEGALVVRIVFSWYALVLDADVRVLFDFDVSVLNEPTLTVVVDREQRVVREVSQLRLHHLDSDAI